MKKLLAMAVLLMMVVMTFANGNEEAAYGGAVTINFAKQGADWMNDWWGGADGSEISIPEDDKWFRDYVMPKFTERTGIEVTIDYLGEGDDTVKELDLRLASNDPYDVAWIYGGKAGKYISSRFSVNLREHIEAEFFDQYSAGQIDAFNPNSAEEIFILPTTAWAFTGTANTSIWPEHLIPEGNSWTLAEFEELAEYVKANYPDKSATYLSISMSYDIIEWASAFGVEMFKDNKPNLNSDNANAVKWLEYLRKMYVNGWVQAADPAEQNWGTLMPIFQSGSLAFSAGHIGFAFWGAQSGIDKGLITEDERFDTRFIEFPTVPGVAARPVIAGPDVIYAYDNRIVHGDALGNAKIEAAVELVKELAVGDSHYVYMRMQRLSPLKGQFSDRKDDSYPVFMQMNQIMSDNGVYDWGMSKVWFQQHRDVGRAMLAKVILEGEDAGDALDWYYDQITTELGY